MPTSSASRRRPRGREAADDRDAAPAPGRDRPAQPPDVHRWRRRAHRPAELPGARPRPGRLAVRHRSRLDAAVRAQAARRGRQAARRTGRRAAAAALDGRVRRRAERPGGPGRRARHPVPAVAAVHGLQPARAAGLRQLGIRERQGPPPGRGQVLPPGLPAAAQAAARRGRPVRAGLRQRAPGRLPLPGVRRTAAVPAPR